MPRCWRSAPPAPNWGRNGWHFFALGAPDFLPGPEAPKAERNVLGLIAAAGVDAGKLVLRARGHCQRIQGVLGGHPIHPVSAVPGGMSKPLTEAERDEFLPWTDEIVRAADVVISKGLRRRLPGVSRETL